MKRCFTLAVAALAWLLPVCLLAQSPPNLILVLIDDLGYSDLSCYGNKLVQTEHIDRLAREGIRFNQFYVAAPICSPSRTAFLTGQFPARWGMTSYLAARSENQRRGMPDWLDPKAPSLARFLRSAGYLTGHFGKWHLGGQRDVGDAPLINEYGFDRSLTQFEGLGDRILPLCDALDGTPPRPHALGSDKLGRGEITWLDRSKVTGAFVEKALEFIKNAQTSKKPFYINLWPDDVHSPFFPPNGIGGKDKKERFLEVVKSMDTQLGQLFSYIREQTSLRTNTIIIVTSDNGPEPGAGEAGRFRGHKGTLYEGGVREPLIVWAPGFMSQDVRGTVDEKTVIGAVDLLPSLAHLAGAKLPRGLQLDGEDFSGALLGRAGKSRARALFWVRPPDRPGETERWPDLAMREGDWKLLLMEDGTSAQLYDLKQDPAESSNVADRNADVVRRLTDQVLDWRKSLPIAAFTATPGAPAATKKSSQKKEIFVNPIAEGADPWVVQHQGKYIACLSEANEGIALYISDRLSSLGKKHVVWTAPDEGFCSGEIWAPELHFLDGHWYVYLAGSDGQNKNHRMWALKSKGRDPLGSYTLHGPLYTGDLPETGAANRWAIDGTILEAETKRFMVWSGWEDDRDIQWLYLAPMKDPLTIAEKRVRLCDNDDYLWERVDENESGRGLHEAPQVLQRNGRTFIVYSCSGSWQPSYKLGLLELRPGGNPMGATNWIKHAQPIFQSSPEIFGVGHNCFVKSPNGTEDWMIYHAKLDRRNGWRRAIYAQPFGWKEDGYPDFGSPAIASAPLSLPGGEAPTLLSGRFRQELRREEDLVAWDYFGHHQFMQVKEDGLHLGTIPERPINQYRSGEKLLVRNGNWSNFTAEVRLRVVKGERDAGLLFRCTLPSVGYDAQAGYFAGLIPATEKIVLGKTDGKKWNQLGFADAPIEAGREYVLSVSAIGPEISVRIDDKEVMRVTDDTYDAGTIGLRVVDVHAVFSKFQVRPSRTPSMESRRRTAATVPIRPEFALWN